MTHEALRLRMAALHGREDPLLDPTRFPRLLRQANDAEIADVRKVGEDEYEITLRRGARPAASSAPAAAPAEPPLKPSRWNRRLRGRTGAAVAPGRRRVGR